MESVDREIFDLEMRSWAAVQLGDGASFERSRAEDLIAIGPWHIADRRTLVELVSEARYAVLRFEVDDVEFHPIRADAVLLAYRAVQDAICDGRLCARAICVSTLYLRRQGSWLAVFHQQAPEASA